MDQLLTDIRSCRTCEAWITPRPVLSVHPEGRLLIIGQAPGTRVHQTGIPWNDPSGDTLRAWLKVDRHRFYTDKTIAIMPMGFCYPGKGASGDLPPRPECAPLWHTRVRACMPHIELTLLIGRYAQDYYLGKRKKGSLAQTVAAFHEYLPEFLPLPHPSPRNRLWMRKNPWFVSEVVPFLQKRTAELGLW
ncbi:MAG: uracil-DNA glycosylase family protein [Saprospiraceae bacterium]|nr:uracil-DNA glycosylase family protein [Saprospiraceae bacterium]